MLALGYNQAINFIVFGLLVYENSATRTLNPLLIYLDSRLLKLTKQYARTVTSDQYSDLDKLLEQAGKKSDSQAVGLDLAAADLAWQQKQPLRARKILEGLDLSGASPAQLMFAKTLEAELALARQQPNSALKALKHPSFERLSEMPLAQQTRSQLVRAQALEDSGKPLAAARERFTSPLYWKGRPLLTTTK